MSVKIRAKNPSNSLQTVSCNSSGHLNVAFPVTEKQITHITLLNETISSNSFSTSINFSSHPSLGGNLWGNSDTHHNIILQFSNDNITFFNIKTLNVINIDNDLTFSSSLQAPPKYIRFHNPKNSSVSINAFIDLIT